MAASFSSHLTGTTQKRQTSINIKWMHDLLSEASTFSSEAITALTFKNKTGHFHDSEQHFMAPLVKIVERKIRRAWMLTQCFEYSTPLCLLVRSSGVCTFTSSNNWLKILWKQKSEKNKKQTQVLTEKVRKIRLELYLNVHIYSWVKREQPRKQSSFCLYILFSSVSVWFCAFKIKIPDL